MWMDWRLLWIGRRGKLEIYIKFGHNNTHTNIQTNYKYKYNNTHKRQKI